MYNNVYKIYSRKGETQLLKQSIIKRGNEISHYLIKIRRDLHRTPELAMEEFVTKKKIKKYLDEIGIDYIEFEHHRGIMAYIYKKNAKTTIGIRGDIDALPIQEIKESEYKSQNDGVMHACGHDAHTTMLIGACKLLYEIKDELNVNIKFFFEPAEEEGGGAKFFIEDGLMENPKVEYMFGAHVQGYLEVGTIESKYGTLNASADSIWIDVKGKRGHGAYPQNGIDALVAAAQIITSLQSIISRNLAPHEMGVLTLGKIQGGDAGNVICDEVKIDGTLRTLDKRQKEFMIQRATEIIENTAAAYRCKAKLTVEKDGYNPLKNDRELIDIVKNNAEEFLGKGSFIFKENPSMGGEDFSFFVENCKGAFFHLGCGNKEKKITSLIHTEDFDIDERCLSIGAIMHVLNVLSFN